MMSLSDKEIEKIHALAMLERQEKDQHLIQEVSQIMDFVEQLRAVNTENIAPLYHPFEHTQTLRHDIVSEESCLAELEAIAPEFDAGLYIVPTIIDRDE